MRFCQEVCFLWIITIDRMLFKAQLMLFRCSAMASLQSGRSHTHSVADGQAQNECRR